METWKLWAFLNKLLANTRIWTKNEPDNKDAGKADCMFTNSRCGWYETRGNYSLNELSHLVIILKTLDE